MKKKEEFLNRSGIDKGLVAWFLKMSPEERLKANDNAIRTILELKRNLEHKKDNRQRQSKLPEDQQRLAVLEETLKQRAKKL